MATPDRGEDQTAVAQNWLWQVYGGGGVGGRGQQHSGGKTEETEVERKGGGVRGAMHMIIGGN